MNRAAKLTNYLEVVIKKEAKILFHWNIPNGNQKFHLPEVK